MNDLKVISAESIDNTHVRLIFSDYIKTIGSVSISPVLTVSNSQIDPQNAKAILLTTSVQTAGVLYTATASGTVGNVQGGINSVYNKAYFTGKATMQASSDFNILSVVATSATGAEITFSHNVLVGSVYREAFFLYETNTLNFLSIEKVSLKNANTVQFALTGINLLDSSKNYQIRINNTGASTDLRRATDNALL